MGEQVPILYRERYRDRSLAITGFTTAAPTTPAAIATSSLSLSVLRGWIDRCPPVPSVLRVGFLFGRIGALLPGRDARVRGALCAWCSEGDHRPLPEARTRLLSPPWGEEGVARQEGRAGSVNRSRSIGQRVGQSSRSYLRRNCSRRDRT
jgi:hypothetical protein